MSPTRFGALFSFQDVSPNAWKIAFSGFIGEPANDQVFVVNTGTGSSRSRPCADTHPGTTTPENEPTCLMNADGYNPTQSQTGRATKDQVPDWSPRRHAGRERRA